GSPGSLGGPSFGSSDASPCLPSFAGRSTYFVGPSSRSRRLVLAGTSCDIVFETFRCATLAREGGGGGGKAAPPPCSLAIGGGGRIGRPRCAGQRVRHLLMLLQRRQGLLRKRREVRVRRALGAFEQRNGLGMVLDHLLRIGCIEIRAGLGADLLHDGLV